MESCPFCKQAVEVDLVRFGGACPHCFLEIPGEEAPTDPGVQAEAETPVDPEPPQRKPLFAAAAVLLILAVGAGLLALQGGDGQAAVEGDPEAQGFLTLTDEEIARYHKHEDPPEADQPPPEGSAGGRRGPTAPEVTDQGSPRFDEPVLDPTGHDEGAGSAGGAPATGGGDIGGLPDLGGGPRQIGAALSDETLIREMIMYRMGAYSRQMETCYERSLKADAGLAGRWLVTFTIRQSGQTANISVRGASASEPDLESCMAAAAERWTFDPLARDFTIEYPFSFSSG